MLSSQGHCKREDTLVGYSWSWIWPKVSQYSLDSKFWSANSLKVLGLRIRSRELQLCWLCDFQRILGVLLWSFRYWIIFQVSAEHDIWIPLANRIAGCPGTTSLKLWHNLLSFNNWPCCSNLGSTLVAWEYPQRSSSEYTSTFNICSPTSTTSFPNLHTKPKS